MTPITRSRGYLPHVESQNPVYFVTFRLVDSLPQELLAQLRAERKTIEKASRSTIDVPADRARLSKLRTILQRAERCLDSGLGQCYMQDPRIAKIVADSIGHFDGQRYQLLAWCVMPNHVHTLFSPSPPFHLASIIQSWKSYSAHQVNSLLHRSGVFWQREYFDHLVRGQSSLLKFATYIEQNPQKAGLRNWPWVSNFRGAVSCTAGVPPASLHSSFASQTRRPESGATKRTK
jgi:REP element-mobilizing transposase RayT